MRQRVNRERARKRYLIQQFARLNLLKDGRFNQRHLQRAQVVRQIDADSIDHLLRNVVGRKLHQQFGRRAIKLGNVQSRSLAKRTRRLVSFRGTLHTLGQKPQQSTHSSSTRFSSADNRFAISSAPSAIRVLQE